MGRVKITNKFVKFRFRWRHHGHQQTEDSCSFSKVAVSLEHSLSGTGPSCGTVPVPFCPSQLQSDCPTIPQQPIQQWAPFLATTTWHRLDQVFGSPESAMVKESMTICDGDTVTSTNCVANDSEGFDSSKDLIHDQGQESCRCSRWISPASHSSSLPSSPCCQRLLVMASTKTMSNSCQLILTGVCGWNHQFLNPSQWSCDNLTSICLFRLRLFELQCKSLWTHMNAATVTMQVKVNVDKQLNVWQWPWHLQAGSRNERLRCKIAEIPALETEPKMPNGTNRWEECDQ